jgi:hypothetical protein
MEDFDIHNCTSVSRKNIKLKVSMRVGAWEQPCSCKRADIAGREHRNLQQPHSCRQPSGATMEPVRTKRKKKRWNIPTCPSLQSTDQSLQFFSSLKLTGDGISRREPIYVPKPRSLKIVDGVRCWDDMAEGADGVLRDRTLCSLRSTTQYERSTVLRTFIKDGDPCTYKIW